MSHLEIVPVERPSDLDAFIDLPWRIYKDHPNWVPPLKKVVRRLLDVTQHPYWEFSRRTLFLARRGSETVGRVAAIVDDNYNRYHGTGMGSWGFFECINDKEVAQGLFSAAEEWVADQGMTYLSGPFNPSTNYEIGLLVEGFEHRATFMMPYNPPYYLDLVEACGFRKEKDLLSFLVDESCKPPEWMAGLAKRFKFEGKYTIRRADLGQAEAEIALVRHIYEEAWSQNWGFVPMSDGEVAEMAKELKMIADPDLIYFVCVGEEPVAVGLLVPDINPLLKRFNGKIGITGLFKYLFYRKEIDGVRGLLFGVKKEYREKGIAFVAMDYTYKLMVSKPEYKYFEMGWNLEDNYAINQLDEEYGAKLFKRYRILRKNFAHSW